MFVPGDTQNNNWALKDKLCTLLRQLYSYESCVVGNVLCVTAYILLSMQYESVSSLE